MKFKATGIFEPFGKENREDDPEFGHPIRCMIVGKFAIHPHPKKKDRFKVSHRSTGLGMMYSAEVAEMGFSFDESYIWAKLLQNNIINSPVSRYEGALSMEEMKVLHQWSLTLVETFAEQIEATLETA